METPCGEDGLTCVGLFYDPVLHQADSSPGAAPEPAGGIQTPGTDDPLSLVAACVAAPPTALPHWSCGPSLRPRALARRRLAPCRGCGLRSDQGQDGVVGPTARGLLAALVWAQVGRALWFCLKKMSKVIITSLYWKENCDFHATIIFSLK